MTKNFAFAESGRKYVQIRFEAFNVTNRVTLGANNTTADQRGFRDDQYASQHAARIETGLKLVW